MLWALFIAFYFVESQVKIPGARFTNDLRETLTYGKLLKHKVYLILMTFG